MKMLMSSFIDNIATGVKLYVQYVKSDEFEKFDKGRQCMNQFKISISVNKSTTCGRLACVYGCVESWCHQMKPELTIDCI